MEETFNPTILSGQATLDDCQPLVRAFYEYWSSSKGEKPMPARMDIDPIEFSAHLPGIILLDFEGMDEAARGIYRYRVVGTYEVESRGYDPTGKLVNDGYFDSELEVALRAYDFVRTNRVPIFETIDFVSDRGVQILEQSIVLPLSENGFDVSQIIVYSERVHQRS